MSVDASVPQIVESLPSEIKQFITVQGTITRESPEESWHTLVILL